MDRLLDYLAKEGAVIRQAPVAFATGVLLVGLIIWAALTFVNSERFATLETRIAFKDDQISALEKKVEDYADLERRMTEVEQRISASQISELQGFLGAGPVGEMKLHVWNGDQAAATGFIEAFQKSGWMVELVSAAGPPSPSLTPIYLSGSADDASLWVEQALTRASIPYASSPEATASASVPLEVWLNADAVDTMADGVN